MSEKCTVKLEEKTDRKNMHGYFCPCLGLQQRKDYEFNKILRYINFVLPAPPAPAYAPSMGLPDIMPPNPYVAPDPCNPCNTCAQCSLQVCSPCAQTCQPLSCPPRIPAKLQPLWQQWNERTAGNSFFPYMMYVLFHYPPEVIGPFHTRDELYV